MALLPIHPPAEPGEALSSWIARIARTYLMSPAEFTATLAGKYMRAREVDASPRPTLIEALADRTGVAPELIRMMTVDGVADALYRAVEFSAIGTVLIPPSMRTGSPYAPHVRRWYFGPPPVRGCAACLKDAGQNFAFPLAWRVSLAICCPTHGMLLGRCDPIAWRTASRSAPAAKQLAPLATEHEVKHDTRLAAALRGDKVQVRAGAVDAATWLAGLLQLDHELGLPGLMLQLPADSRRELGLTDRDRRSTIGMLAGRDVENLGQTSRQRFARAVASAVNLIEGGRMMAMGRGAFVCALRPKTLLPRAQRVRLTYSEPEVLPRPPFRWPECQGEDEWVAMLEDPVLDALYRQHQKRNEPKVIQS